jgi:hypothetical protein
MLAVILPMAWAGSARADTTVSFATDGPAPAMHVSVVEEPEAEGVSPTPEVVTTAAIEAAPATPRIEVRFVRVGDGSGESATLVLRDESGAPGVDAIDRLSILARPRGVDVPAAISHDDADWLAPDVRRLHPGLLPLLAGLAERFPGRAIEIVSGFRPGAREGSRHRVGRAIDLRVEGVSIDEVHAALDGEPCTGLGLYPTSGFVHLDVRTETVRWTDDSGPGEAPRIVRSEVVQRDRDGGSPSPDAPRSEDTAEAVERALRAADAITLDLGLR